MKRDSSLAMKVVGSRGVQWERAWFDRVEVNISACLQLSRSSQRRPNQRVDEVGVDGTTTKYLVLG